MRRLIVAALAAVCVVTSLAYAGSGTDYSRATTMTFQNGLNPTVGYTGAADTYIRLGTAAADSGKNYGASDTLKVSGPSWTGYQPGINKTLISFDVSALPDSAVILQAYLYLYQNIGNTGSNTDTAQVYTMLWGWNEGTGVASGTTGQATSADWNNRTGKAWKASGVLTRAGRRWASADSSLSTTFTGPDTTNTALTTGYSVDVSSEYETPLILKSGAAATSKFGWIAFDVTKQVRLWNNGAIVNGGFLIESHNVGNNKVFGFWSSNYAGKAYRPKLVVKYFDPTSGTSSGGRRVIGGGGGAVH